jgi:hypothetical protein
MMADETERELYCQKDFPIFQNRMYDTYDEARNCPKGDIHLVENMNTGLIRNSSFDHTLMDYDSKYQNEQGTSKMFQKHLLQVANLIERKIGNRGLVEVGCGKGTFLELMLERNADIVGYDPTYEGNNPRVKREYFSDDLGIQGEGLILRHVLEHIDQPVDFLFDLASANGSRGLIYIEVPCFDWICENRAWFDIFYEHVNYFRLSDFRRLFGRLIHADRGFGGQYLRIIGDLSTLRVPKRDANNCVDFPHDFTSRVERDLGVSKEPSIVWGGASKGVIYSLLRERAGCPVDRIIDINPAKQEKFLPAVGLKVLSPEKGLQGLPVGTIIKVMNPNYLHEIQEMVGANFVCKGVNND